MIRRWATRYGARLSVEPKRGVELVVDDPRRSLMSKELEGAGHPLSVSPRERHQLLLFFLLSAKGPLTRSQLEERLPVSLATLSRDLTCVEPWLSGFRLAAERRPRLGISVRGEEEDRRRALITLVLGADVDGLLLHLALWGKAPSSRDLLLEHPFNGVLVRELTDWGLDVAWRYISRVETALQRHF
ncbi:MAG TPA: hypothetical protein VFI11_06945, partial [Anaerolineales bacterium]|nr:hypothetical protein [Anaerolineales bacterium]